MTSRVLALLAAGLLVFACSSSNDTPAGPAGACGALVDAQRSRVDRCHDSPGFLDAPEFSAYCAAFVGAPGMAAVGPVGACAAKLKDLPCSQTISDVPECQAFDEHGTLADGAACASGGQCGSGSCAGGRLDDNEFRCGKCGPRLALGAACSEGQGDCAAGAKCRTLVDAQGNASSACVPVVIVNEGEVCSAPDKALECAAGLRCVSAGDSVKCKKPLVEGAACGASDVCGGALQCVSGKCQLRGGEGATCDSGSQCWGGFTCDAAAKKCVAVKLLAVGDACGGQVLNAKCVATAFCPAGSTSAKCTAYKAKGEACTATDRCTPYTACLDGKCAVPDPSTCK